MPDFSFCPQCNTKYRTAGMPAMKRLRCKKCQGIFIVPEDSADKSLAATPEKKPDAQPDKDAEHAIPAAIGDSSALGRANFKGGVTLDGSPLPAVDDGSASQDTIKGLPRPVEKKIEAAIKPSATDQVYEREQRCRYKRLASTLQWLCWWASLSAAFRRRTAPARV